MAQRYILDFGNGSRYYLLFLTISRNDYTIEEKAIPHYRLTVLRITSVIAIDISHKSVKP